MLFGTKHNLEYASDFTIQIQDKNIERVTKFSYLGVDATRTTEME